MKLISLEHEIFNETNVLNNEQYNNFVWHGVHIHESNAYDKYNQCYYKRYMPVFYEYNN